MNQQLKKILKKTFVYDAYIKTKHKRRIKYFNSEATELLQHFSTALNAEHIIFWLDFGTLLGYYREHDFIPYDMDLDVGAFLKDQSNIQDLLLKHGFTLVRQFKVVGDNGMEECYRYKHTTIDVFYYREDGDNIYCNSFGPAIPGKFQYKRPSPIMVKRIDLPNNGFKQVEYKNSKVYIPQNPQKYLSMHYGKDFMVPNPDFDYKKEATNITYFTWEQKQGECIFYERII